MQELKGSWQFKAHCDISSHLQTYYLFLSHYAVFKVIYGGKNNHKRESHEVAAVCTIPHPHSNEKFANALISPTMLSHFTPPSIQKAMKVEEKRGDNLRPTKDTSIENPSKKLWATDAEINHRKSTIVLDTLTITGLKQEQQHNIREEN